MFPVMTVRVKGLVSGLVSGSALIRGGSEEGRTLAIAWAHLRYQ